MRGPPARDTGKQTMSSVVQDRYGPAPEGLFRVAEIDRPTRGDGEVLVRVHAASVDRGIWHIMAGLPYPPPLAGPLEDVASTIRHMLDGESRCKLVCSVSPGRRPTPPPPGSTP